MASFNPVAPSAASGSTYWGDIIGGVNDIFGSWSTYNLKKKELGYAAQNSGSSTPGGYARPPSWTAPINYQKWGLIIGVVGLALAVYAFVKK